MSEITGDPVELEQYLDFVANRAFRQSLLCRDDEPETSLDLECLRQLRLVADLRSPPKLDLRRARPQVFTSTAGVEFEVQHPLAKAVLAELAGAFTHGKAFEDVLMAGIQRVSSAGAARYAEEANLALDELFALIVMQHVEPMIETPAQSPRRTERPCATRLARSQAELGWSHLSTVTHRSLDLDDFARSLVLLLDGSRDERSLQREMLAWLDQHQNINGRARPEVVKNLNNNLSRLLKLFARHGVLSF